MAELSVDPSVSPPWSWRRLNAVFMLTTLMLIGCGMEESYCRTGINAKNAPRHFVVMERADEATHYVPDAEDARLLSIRSKRETLFTTDGRYIEPWPSCQNIDGFDEVHRLDIQNIVQVNGLKLQAKGPKPCSALPFYATTDVSDIRLQLEVDDTEWWWGEDEDRGAIAFKNDHYPFRAILRSASLTFGETSASFSTVHLSHISEEGVFSSRHGSYLPPTGGRSAFEGAGKAGEQPPFILVRLWHFSGDARPEADMLLGKDEMEGSGYICADMYYGYFAEK